MCGLNVNCLQAAEAVLADFVAMLADHIPASATTTSAGAGKGSGGDMQLVGRCGPNHRKQPANPLEGRGGLFIILVL